MRVVLSSRSTPKYAGDVGDYEFVDALVSEVRPDLVFQLAARSTASHGALRDNHRTISGGCWSVCEAVARHCPQAKVFLPGSGLQFLNDGEPIDETTAFSATSPYAVERIHTVYAARYFRDRGLRTYVGYLFHHDSPRRAPGHLSMRIARAAVEIASGGAGALEIGDATVQKEWGFAGDIAAGMLTLLGQDQVHEAVIGTGVAHSVAEWAERCFEHVGLDWREHSSSSASFTPDFDRLVSNPARIRALGWEPRVDMGGLCEMVMQSMAVQQV